MGIFYDIISTIINNPVMLMKLLQYHHKLEHPTRIIQQELLQSVEIQFWIELGQEESPFVSFNNYGHTTK